MTYIGIDPGQEGGVAFVWCADVPGSHAQPLPFNGKEFDASWNRGAPLDFRVGIGQVIKGWDDGLLGMRVGGRRRLVIPPHLGYGARGAGTVIKPGETLIFVVDLVDVR